MTTCIGCGSLFDEERWVLWPTQNRRVRVVAVTNVLCPSCWPSRRGKQRLLTTWRALPDPPPEFGDGLLICGEGTEGGLP